MTVARAETFSFRTGSTKIMKRVIISGTGVTIPESVIGNEALVASYNAWVERENPLRAAQGLEPLRTSSVEFIEHASGIRQRHVHTPDGILDIDRMAPRIPALAGKLEGTALAVKAPVPYGIAIAAGVFWSLPKTAFWQAF